MIKYFYLFLGLIFMYSCTGTYEANQKKSKELYGECDNPADKLKMNKMKYQRCKAKERAGGESLFGLEGDLSDIISGKNKDVVYQYSVNPFLWSASLEVTKSYPLKIADNTGGFIETDWITDSNNSSQRCLIKIQISSKDLITTGVNTNFICENKSNDTWFPDNIEYSEEEKQITLKILEIAGRLANAPQ